MMRRVTLTRHGHLVGTWLAFACCPSGPDTAAVRKQAPRGRGPQCATLPRALLPDRLSYYNQLHGHNEK